MVTLLTTTARAIGRTELCAGLLHTRTETVNPVALIVVGSLPAAWSKELVFGSWTETVLLGGTDGLTHPLALAVGRVE